jgi:hypothetical protein
LLKEEAEYFTNQSFKEIRRVTMIDYEQARDSFVDMSEMMLRFIYEVSRLTQRVNIYHIDEYQLARIPLILHCFER